MIKKWAKNKKILFLYLFFIIIICYLVLRNIHSLNSITIISDEFGYWYAGAVFAGLDWREVAYLNPYYGFGYGILLCPLFLFFDDAVLMYRIAIGYNAVFMTFSFILGVRVMTKLKFQIQKEWMLVISFLTTVYSNLIFQSQTTQVECLLNFLFWLTLYFLVNIIQRQRLWDYICMSLICGYMYAVHMRSIGVVFTSAITLILFASQNKKLWKKTLLYLILLLIMFVLVNCVKSNLKNYTYAPLPLYQSEVQNDNNIFSELNEDRTINAKVNDYESVMQSVIQIFSVNGILKLFINIIGKIYYLFASSLFLVFYASLALFRYIYYGIHKIKKNQKNSTYFWISIYLVVSVLSAIGIASIFLLNYHRQDMIVYGRYTEYVIGPFLVLGFYILLKYKVSIKLICFGYIFETIIAYIVQYIITTGEFKQYLDNNAVGLVNKIIYLFGDLGSEKFAISILILIFLQSLAVYFLFNTKKIWTRSIAVILCALIWIQDGNEVYKHNILRQQTELINTIDLAQYLKINALEKEIYYVDDYVPYMTIDYIQFQLPKHIIKVISANDLQNQIKKGYYLVPNTSALLHMEESSCVKKCNKFKLYYFE